MKLSTEERIAEYESNELTLEQRIATLEKQMLNYGSNQMVLISRLDTLEDTLAKQRAVNEALGRWLGSFGSGVPEYQRELLTTLYEALK